MKKSLYILIVIAILSSSVNAQVAYSGGSGDGHSMATLVLGTVSSTIDNSYISIHPNIIRSGGTVYFPGEINVKEIYLVGVNGTERRVLSSHSGIDKLNAIRIESPLAGLYFLRLQTDDGRTHHSKLIILNH